MTTANRNGLGIMARASWPLSLKLLNNIVKHPFALLTILCLTLAACVTSRSGQVSRAPERSFFLDVPKEDQEIYLAVLDRMFARWEGNAQKSGLPLRYYIKIQDTDAPPDLLAALRAKGREVFPASAFKNGRGVELSLNDIERKGHAQASVNGGYLYDPEGGESGPFVLSRQHGRWTVVSWEPIVFASWNWPNQHMERVATCRYIGGWRPRRAIVYPSPT